MSARYEVDVNGRTRHLVVTRQGGAFAVTVDGRPWLVDAASVGGHRLSLLISPHEQGPIFSHDVALTRNAVTGGTDVRIGTVVVRASLNGRRHSGRREEEAHAGAGPQRLLAPMPGKVVRVLARKGEAVRARQPIVVIEAMKMENEVRAGRDGVVTELPAAPGQLVDAGSLLAVVA